MEGKSNAVDIHMEWTRVYIYNLALVYVNSPFYYSRYTTKGPYGYSVEYYHMIGIMLVGRNE